MTDLAARLTDALDRAEQATKAAGLDLWVIDHHACDSSCDECCEWLAACAHGTCGHCVIDGGDIRIYDEGGHDAAQAAHIVAWQPARILASIARDRVLLTVHYRMTPDRPERMLDELRDGWCSACLPPDTPGASMYAPWPCESMCLAAAFWLPGEAL